MRRSSATESRVNFHQTVVSSVHSLLSMMKQPTTDEMDEILKALNESSIETLDLGDKKFEGVGGVAVAGALERNTALTTLNLRRNDLREGGGVAVAGALERNTTLTELNLMGNGLGEGGGKAVARALERNTTLTTLDLRYNGLGEGFGVAVAGALERNTTLTALDLGGNGLRYATAIRIRQLLASRRPPQPPPPPPAPVRVKAAVPAQLRPGVKAGQKRDRDSNNDISKNRKPRF